MILFVNCIAVSFIFKTPFRAGVAARLVARGVPPPSAWLTNQFQPSACEEASAANVTTAPAL